MQKWKYALNRLFNRRTKDINDELYEEYLKEIIEYIIVKIQKEYMLYENLLEGMKEMFGNRADELSLEEKENTIKEMFKLLKCNSANANFKFLNSKYSSAFGKKNDRIISNAFIINKSTAGIREKVDEF